MVENYSFRKEIDMHGIDIQVTVMDRDLLLKLDDAIRETIIQYYGLNGEGYD